MKKKLMSTAACRLSQRINLTAQARQIDRVSGEHGNRLNCSRQSSSPHYIAGRDIQRECTSRLNTNKAVADHWRCGHHFAHSGLPAQAARLSLECIEKAVLAAD